MNVIKYMSVVLLALLAIACSKEAPVEEVPPTPIVTEEAPVAVEPAAEAPVEAPVEVAPAPVAEPVTEGGGGYTPTADELVPGVTE